MANPYYQPEEFGLVPIAEIDYSDGFYQFDTRVVWRNTESGEIYTARDSGCSCPIPFENFETLESLDKFNFETIRHEAMDEHSERTPAEIMEFLEKLRGL